MMKRLNTSSVRFRSAAWATAALAVLVLLSALAINWLVGRQVRTAADNVLLEQAQDRAQLLASGAPAESLVTVVGHEVIAAVVDADGNVLAVAGTPDQAALGNLQPGVRSLEIEVLDDDDGDEPEGPHRESLRAAIVSLEDGTRVIVGNEGEQTNQTLASVRAVLLIGAPSIVIAGAAILWLLTGRALRPIARMRDDLAGIVDAKKGGRVTQPETKDEIDDLATSMNDVLGRLEQQSATRRQFVADASHELKSPVANARVLLETGGSPTMVLSEIDRLQNLVDDLLFLAQTDETAPARATVVDLDDVVSDEAERAAIRTDRRIDASAVQPATVTADRSYVARAVRNLLENAVRHGHSLVTVGIEEEPDHWVVFVADDGPGIPDADRERIFTRFSRLESERSRGEGGTGLGLSIVEAIATSSGGSVAVATHGGPGARLELRLPRSN